MAVQHLLDMLGVLIARVRGSPLPEFMAEQVSGPLGMTDSGFEVPTGKLDRFTSSYRTGPDGGLELVDAPDGQWSRAGVPPPKRRPRLHRR